MALLLKTHHAFLQPCEPFARSSIPILRVLGNGPLKAQGDTARRAKSRMAQYSDASPILQLHANGKHHSDVRRRCPLYPRKRTLELSHEMSALCQKQTSADRFDRPAVSAISCLRRRARASSQGRILPLRTASQFAREP